MEKMGQLQQQTKKEDISLLTEPKIGHFYFGKNRTFLLWLDKIGVLD
jgi:hypothetical protein